MTATRTGTPAEVAELLRDPRYEIMPFESFAEQLTHLPAGATVTITASPQKEIEATVRKAELAAERGFEAVPHLAARYVRDVDHLAALVERLRAAGVTDVFVPGGDREEPLGEFESAFQLLRALEDLDQSFEAVGITGYPEGHPFLSAGTLADSMERKLPYATYISTQLCYDPGAIRRWIEELRARGVDLPVQVGIPGVLRVERLLRISRKVGVGDSMEFLHKTSGIVGFVRQLVGSRGRYRPDDLVEGLAPLYGDATYGIAGVHIYTFNQAADTEAWRRKRVDDGKGT